MPRRIPAIVSAIVLLQFITACVSFTPTVGTQASPEPGMAYVYGRFSLQSYRTTGVGHHRMGLVMQATEAETNYILPFELSGSTSRIPQSPFIVAVKPGTYAFKKVIYAYWDTRKGGESALKTGPLTKPFLIEAGRAYYIADVAGHASSTSHGGVIRDSWDIHSIKNNYENTTAEIREKYPSFQKIETLQVIKFE